MPLSDLERLLKNVQWARNLRAKAKDQETKDFIKVRENRLLGLAKLAHRREKRKDQPLM